MLVEHHLMNPSETDRILGICSNVLRSHSPVYRNWTEGDRITMLRWYADMGLMLVVEDPDVSPDGVQRDLSFCLVRFLPDIQSRLHPYLSDPLGILYTLIMFTKVPIKDTSPCSSKATIDGSPSRKLPSTEKIGRKEVIHCCQLDSV